MTTATPSAFTGSRRRTAGGLSSAPSTSPSKRGASTGSSARTAPGSPRSSVSSLAPPAPVRARSSCSASAASAGLPPPGDAWATCPTRARPTRSSPRGRMDLQRLLKQFLQGQPCVPELNWAHVAQCRRGSRPSPCIRPACCAAEGVLPPVGPVRDVHPLLLLSGRQAPGLRPHLRSSSATRASLSVTETMASPS